MQVSQTGPLGRVPRSRAGVATKKIWAAGLYARIRMLAALLDGRVVSIAAAGVALLAHAAWHLSDDAPLLFAQLYLVFVVACAHAASPTWPRLCWAAYAAQVPRVAWDVREGAVVGAGARANAAAVAALGAVMTVQAVACSGRAVPREGWYGSHLCVLAGAGMLLAGDDATFVWCAALYVALFGAPPPR